MPSSHTSLFIGRPMTSHAVMRAIEGRSVRRMPFIAAPEVVRNKAIAAGTPEWLDRLPQLVASLERDWSIEVGAVFGDATEAYVAAATVADGTEAVLKVLVPRDGDAAQHEITVLQLADGEGCVRLLRSDVERGAMLLERLGPSLHDLALPIDERHQILCATAQRLWRPAPNCGLPTGAQKGRWLVEHIVTAWEALDRPCSEQAVEHAVACAERRIVAHDDERAVLVHGDVHEWNVLRGHDGYRLVDPDGLLAEAEYDLGIIMREDPVELMTGDPFDRARMLATRTGRDAIAIWEWGVVERVSTGLLAERIDLQPVGRQMLTVADRLAADHAEGWRV
jgi:streptomycin 6-kinase